MSNLKEKPNNDIETIELSLPFKAEYVSTARLTVSSIASKMGFDFDEVEDIKVALSEVCSKFINVGSTKSDFYKLIFKVYKEKLAILFYCDDDSLNCIFDEDSDGLGTAIIMALMDDVELCTEDTHIILISKVLKGEKLNAI